MSTIHVQKRIKQSGALATARYDSEERVCSEYQCALPAHFSYQLFAKSPPAAKWWCAKHFGIYLTKELSET